MKTNIHDTAPQAYQNFSQRVLSVLNHSIFTLLLYPLKIKPTIPITEITNQNKAIIIVDYSQCRRKEQMLSLLAEATSYFKTNKEPHLRILMDFTNAFGSTEFMDKAKSDRLEVLKTKTAISAIIGISGIKKILLKGYNALSPGQGMKPFDTKEQAIDYLTSN